MLEDEFGREVSGVRVSLTDRCNFDCIYCHNEGLGDTRGPMDPQDGEMTADDVVVENLTVRNYTENGVYWTGGVDGYRASHVVSVNNRIYGIYAFRSIHGRFEHCYASGSDDAGYYIGGVQPGHAVITDCVAERNAQGFSGTNTGGDIVIRDSIWRHNVAAITPNSLDSQRNPPQGHVAGGIRIEGNEIHDNNNLDAPAGPIAYALFGNGITIPGGTNNDVVDNHIYNQEKYGVAVTPIVDDNFYRPRGNAVVGNTIEDSGRADLALAFPARDNRFADNEVSSTRPAFLQHRDGSLGDLWVFLQMLADFVQAEYGADYPRGETAEQPPPDESTLAELDAMDDPESAPPRPPIGGREP
jgi:hypothetical protein